jgi:hypothetical protein
MATRTITEQLPPTVYRPLNLIQGALSIDELFRLMRASNIFPPENLRNTDRRSLATLAFQSIPSAIQAHPAQGEVLNSFYENLIQHLFGSEMSVDELMDVVGASGLVPHDVLNLYAGRRDARALIHLATRVLQPLLKAQAHPEGRRILFLFHEALQRQIKQIPGGTEAFAKVHQLLKTKNSVDGLLTLFQELNDLASETLNETWGSLEPRIQSLMQLAEQYTQNVSNVSEEAQRLLGEINREATVAQEEFNALDPQVLALNQRYNKGQKVLGQIVEQIRKITKGI